MIVSFVAGSGAGALGGGAGVVGVVGDVVTGGGGVAATVSDAVAGAEASDPSLAVNENASAPRNPVLGV